jgi:hypothetical protein
VASESPEATDGVPLFVVTPKLSVRRDGFSLASLFSLVGLCSIYVELSRRQAPWPTLYDPSSTLGTPVGLSINGQSVTCRL